MKFAFVAKHRTIWPVAWLCDALGVSRSGFHAWLNRSPSARSRSDEELGGRVKASFAASDRTYGARRAWRDLLADGADCGLHRIERLMRLQGLRGTAARSALAEGQRRSTARNDAGQPSGPAVRCRASEPEMDRRLHLSLDGRRLALCGSGDRPVLTPRGGLVDECRHDGAARAGGAASRMRCCITPTRVARADSNGRRNTNCFHS